MDRADFIHLLRLGEQDSARNPGAYRRGLAWFAALGYSWVLGCAALAAGVLAWVAQQWLAGVRFRGYWIVLVLFALGLLWSSLRALWVRLTPPEGQALAREQAPALFEVIDRVQRKVKGPPIHRVVLNDEFNAAILQLPRFGLFGGSRNYLVLGLPLLMALDPRRLAAVLAHEYGHLRGDHSRFSAWVYRSRMAWGRLHDDMSEKGDLFSAASRVFLNWYFPRFHARSFAMARQDEYEADNIAGKLAGAHTMCNALMEINIKSIWLGREFWPAHWRQARDQALPVGPYRALARLAIQPPEKEFAQQALREALRRIPSEDDTHPVLRDRLEALEPEASAFSLRSFSTQGALQLLADPQHWTDHFDNEWKRSVATDWKRHHAWYQRLKGRIAELDTRHASLTPSEMAELGDLMRQLDPKADAMPWFERALEKQAEHPEALRGLVQSLPAAEREQKLAILQRLYDSGASQRWWSSQQAVALLEENMNDDAGLKRWRERLREAVDAEERAWEELGQPPFLDHVFRPDLSLYELGEVRAELQLWDVVASASIASKRLREFPWRRCYAVAVTLTGKVPDEHYGTICHELARRLPLPGPVIVISRAHGVDVQRLPPSFEKLK